MEKNMALVFWGFTGDGEETEKETGSDSTDNHPEGGLKHGLLLLLVLSQLKVAGEKHTAIGGCYL